MTNWQRNFMRATLAVGCLAAGSWAGNELLWRPLDPDIAPAAIASLRDATGAHVMMFSTTTCVYCQRARELLDREGVPYTDFVIDQSPQAGMRFRDLGGGGVPLLLIGDRAIRGFSEIEIMNALAE